MNNDSHHFISNIVANGAESAAKWMRANTANSKVQRRAYLDVERHIRSFASGQSPKEWIVMPGLRGTGKTTLLTQIYHDPKIAMFGRYFVSLDQVKLVGGSMVDLIEVLEANIGSRLEDVIEPIVLLFDEVQYMQDWALAIKTVYDRSSRIMIICTGSSALLLQRNPDVTRRVDYIKIHPLCFTEYLMIKEAQAGRNLPKAPFIKMPVKGLAENLREAIFGSTTSMAAYTRLRGLQSSVDNYWRGMAKNDTIGEYLKYGTLPFALTIPDETNIWSRISQLMSDVLVRDVTELQEFDSQTVSTLPRILFILASSNEVSINSLASTVGLDIRTIRSVIDALEKTEIITAIPPKGSAYVKVRKASKYLFTSPAMRAALCYGGATVTVESRSNLMGSLLEDLVGLYFKRLFLDSSAQSIVEYDFTKGGADFIVQVGPDRHQSTVIEVGLNKKTSRQIEHTQKAIMGKYGIVITNCTLHIDDEKNVLYLPLEFFLLI